MSTVNDSTIQPGYEPIPGYRLQEQIGSGGFGEVWRSEAPGGLLKAIKFVHGALNERQATRELRSLERIKGVHHPFLLTLERFEVVAGRLIIVTELADGSLEDVFRRHRDRGSCGIPRAALLAYLQDAADALDYLHDRYQLQHLDVKPGNLLMVGGHVKVADFGLLKDLRDVDCSVIGGLTPIYAPPEVFDGRPSPTSDQYSLAVMYQELLTGTRPFTGRTIAQLATQHVHSAPNLEPLPAADRPVIARALEKNPSRRYGGCLELVEALRSAAGRSTEARSRAESRAFGNGDTWETDADTHTSTVLHAGRAGVPPVEDLPRLKTDQAVAQANASTHVLMVAVGGTGADCLHLLRGRVAARHADRPLDLHSVLIDTASETIDAARLGEASDRVRPCTPIWIPLRTPGQYRDSGTKHLTSISRRWVYNVPRSGRTEGLRPLGRLALVDHGEEVLRKLSEAVGHLAAVAGDSTPHVYLVGSLGGGTGSGTAWDLAHLLRHLLDECGLPQATITPLLTSPALEPSLREPLAIADFHAAISEMHHYLSPGNSYPGDPGIGWPGVPAARSPLNDAYVIAARDSNGDSPTPVEMICDYIWADSVVAGPLLRAARDAHRSDAANPDAPGHHASGDSMFRPVVRSLGITSLESADQVERPRLTRALTTRMLHAWLGRPAEAREIAAHLHAKLARRCGLDLAQLAESVWAPLPSDARARLADLAATLAQGDLLTPLPFEQIEGCVREATWAAAETREALEEQVQSLIQALRRELSTRLQVGRLDIATALECVARIAEEIRDATDAFTVSVPPQDSAAHTTGATLRIPPLLPTMVAWAGSPGEPGPELRYADQCLQSTLGPRLAELLDLLDERLAELLESLTDHAAQLAAAIQLLGEPRGAGAVSAGETWSWLPETIRGRGEQMIEALHSAVASPLLASPVLAPEPTLDGEAIVAATSSAARQLIDRALDTARSAAAPADAAGNGPAATETATTGDPGTVNGDRDLAPIVRAVRSVRPSLLTCGGQQRLLLLVGSEAEGAALQSQVADAHGGTLSVAIVPGITPLLIHEAQQIPLAGVLNRLASMMGGDQQISVRLQTRSDIRWNSNDGTL